MHRALITIALALWIPWVSAAGLPTPTVDLRDPAETPPLATWAHAGGTAALKLESPRNLDLVCDIYQIDRGAALPIARGLALPPLKPGDNLLQIPLPKTSERGKLLLKIISSPDGKPISNLMVDILPKDAWDSLSKCARDGKVFIDPSLRTFKTWAASHDIPASEATPEKTAEYYFGKPAAHPDSPQPGRFVIFERDAPDAFPVIEVLTFPGVTKIVLPPGFLETLPGSATAQALLLKSLNLLP
jgi:hypothetical protein